MTWSSVGTVNTDTLSGATTLTIHLPSGVQGGDLITVGVCFTTGGAATTFSLPGFTGTPGLFTGARSATHDQMWGGYRIAAGTPGSATTDTTFTVTFGATVWGEAVTQVLRSTIGVGTVTSAIFNTAAAYQTACPDPTFTPSAGQLNVWFYAGQNSTLGTTATTFSGGAAGTLSNFVQVGITGNGGGVGAGWQSGGSAPGGTTANQAVDPTDFVIGVTEGAPPVTPRPNLIPPGRQSPMAFEFWPRISASQVPDIQFRAATTVHSEANVTTAAFTLPAGWQPGDLCLIGFEVGTSGQTITQTSGSTFTVQATASNAGATATYWYGYRVLQAGDTAPTFTFTSNKYAGVCIAMYSLSGKTLAVDAWATIADTGVLSASATPNAVTAAGGGEASVILTVGRSGTNVAEALTSWVPPAGWTADASASVLSQASGTNTKWASADYQLNVSGTVTPGAETLTLSPAATFMLTAAHVLITASASTPVTLADVAAGISEDGALVVAAGVPLPEAGGAVESVSVAVAEAPPSDVAGAVESLSVAVAVPLADAAGAVESNAISLALADAAGAVDSLAVTVAVPLAEAGGAVDTLAVQAAVPLAEVGAAADSPSIAAAVPLAEAGAAADTITEAVTLGLADVAGAVESQVSGQPVAFADVAGAADSVVAAAAVPLPEVAGAVEALAVAVTLSLPDVAGAVEAEVSGVPIGLAEVAGAVDLLTTSAALAVPDAAGAVDTLTVAVALALPDVAAAAEFTPRVLADSAAALDTLSVTVSVPLSESAGAADQLVPNAAVAFSEAAGATDLVLVVTGIHPSGTITWTAAPDQPRWKAAPDSPRWKAAALPGRWSASPGTARWRAAPELARWRIMMAAFDPISSDSLEEVNVRWTSDLDGVTVDPTVSPLTVQIAFPVSSGDPLHPNHASAWYAASWLSGGTGKGYVAQCLVGPGGGTVTLAAGRYDVWSWVQGTPESPKKFAGVLTVY